MILRQLLTLLQYFFSKICSDYPKGDDLFKLQFFKYLVKLQVLKLKDVKIQSSVFMCYCLAGSLTIS